MFIFQITSWEPSKPSPAPKASGKKYSFFIDLQYDAQGKGRLVKIEFFVDKQGRARLCTEENIPRNIRRKYGNSLLSAVLSATGLQVHEDKLGYVLMGSDRKKLDYHVEFSLKDGSEGIPYVVDRNGVRIYCDVRNVALSELLDGALIKMKISSAACDLRNSSIKPITKVFTEFKLYNLDGSETLVYSSNERRFDDERQLRFDYVTETAKFEKLYEYHLLYNLQKERLMPKKAGWLDQIAERASRFRDYQSVPAAPQPAKADSNELGMTSSLQYQTQKGKEACGMPVQDLAPANVFQASFDVIADGMTLAIGNSRPQVSVKPYMGMQAPADLRASQKTKPLQERRQSHAGSASASKENKQSQRSSEPKPIPLSSLKNLKAAIFDLDGVVVDSEKAHLASFNQCLAPLGVKIDAKIWRRQYTGIGSYAIMRDVFQKNCIKEDVHLWVQKRAEIYQGYIQKNGLREIQGFAKVYKFLSENGVKVAVASGGHEPHIAKSLELIGLPKIRYVGLESVKRRKPAPDTFLVAAKRLKVKPSQCVVFEDSLAGVEAAANAKMPCIALSTTLRAGALKGRAALIVKNFKSSALKKLLSRLVNKPKLNSKKKR